MSVSFRFLKEYNIDKETLRLVSWSNLIKLYKTLHKVSDSVQVSALDYFSTFVVITKGSLKLEFLFSYFAGVLEDEEEITLYSECCESYGYIYGKIRISKKDFSITIEPYDFIED